jgi:orotate phosphoribosyltransferase
MAAMLNDTQAREQLRGLLKKKSISYGDFTLASGAKSHYYVDCRLSTLDPEGAWLIGQVLHGMIRAEAGRRGISVTGLGGLTMGADPIALAVAMFSQHAGDRPALQPFVVRKAPKSHGQTKLIEGNFQAGDSVVVIDDVITTGDSTIKALDAVVKEGGKVAFVAVLVDRQQGGREKIEALGHKVISVFQKNELIDEKKP